ncbi:MAG: pyruvate kinase [Thermoplasmata archaeon]|nr:MAG: pyruvate kinase [Thermoplasmata archaeon]
MAAQDAITKSKIICTLGPSSNTKEMIEKLAKIGMDCARINFSHGSPEMKIDLFNEIRNADEKLAILCDIQGPKIRIGRIKEGGANLRLGEKITVTTEDIEGDENRITISYGELPKEIKVGELIFINDGIVCLRSEDVQGNEIECSILSGGFISSRKGVNLPSTEISLKVPTDKDKEDLKVIAGIDPEYVAVSFVSEAGDVNMVRKILEDNGNDKIKLISKIERPVALEHFDAILKASDGIMVARGDLGVELPPEQVLPVQKEMIRKCNTVGKPIIVATQMLESMVKSPIPTRAEVSDVFNAIEDGADAVMLSAETASGDFPNEAVTIMERIIRVSESLIPARNPDDYDSDEETIAEIIGHLVFSACKEFKDMNYEKGKIICMTQSGYSAKMISKYRPPLPIFAVTSNERTSRELRMVWGVEPVLVERLDDAGKTIARIKVAVEECLEKEYIDRDEKVIISGNFFNFPSKTNMVSIFTADDVMKLT